MTAAGSNPQSQQASGRRPMPYTVRQLGLANARALAHEIKTGITFMAYLTVGVCDRHSTSLETRDWAIHVQ